MYIRNSIVFFCPTALDVRGSRTQNAAVDSHDLVESGIMKQVVSQPWNNHLKNYRCAINKFLFIVFLFSLDLCLYS